MKLFFKCIYCSEINYLPYRHMDRGSLRNECGQAISWNCSKCRKHCIVGVNEVKARGAKLNGVILIGSFVVAILLLALSFYRYSESGFNVVLLSGDVLLVVPVLFSIVYSYSEQNSVKLFNRYYV